SYELKTVQEFLFEGKPLLDASDLELYQWTAKYYHYSLGQLLFDCLPSIDKLQSNSAKLKFSVGAQGNFEFNLSHEQQSIVHSIMQTLSPPLPVRSLIHGVTGSGKTAIYIELIKQVIASGKSVLFLLPEINLTPQFIATFEKHLHGNIFAYHSHVSESKKIALWKDLLFSPAALNTPKVIVGTRSAIFLPLRNLGMIILDEEHDLSYKQDARCPYHTREVASKKAVLLKIPLIMGTATPSVEVFHAHTNEHAHAHTRYFTLKNRIENSSLPDIEFVDARKPEHNLSNASSASSDHNSKKRFVPDPYWPLTAYSIEQIKENFKEGNQTIIFANKLGFARYIQCKSCGLQFECKNCTTKLRYFQKKNILSCQFCNFTLPLPEFCPACGCLNLIRMGFGTEKIIAILKETIPEASSDRFDRDEIKTLPQLIKKLERFHSHQVDILVGTQMITKGHNFKKVKLVVILGTDDQLNFPDFRANEKVYQLLTQVSGRSGRFGGKSKVLIQTMNLGGPLFEHIQHHTFDHFYQQELEMRRQTLFPPFVKMAALYITSKDQKQVVKTAFESKNLLEHFCETYFKGVFILGPKPGMIEKRVGQYTWCLLLKSSDLNQLHRTITAYELNFATPHSIHLKIDIDPYDFY
ncbi:MAG: primosomal protein N', partial [Oligoflexia bacterium]|nr:primosomal protein N' [Oligoflexia bacterium]